MSELLRGTVENLKTLFHVHYAAGLFSFHGNLFTPNGFSHQEISWPFRYLIMHGVTKGCFSGSPPHILFIYLGYLGHGLDGCKL